jgi:hypothetical protein
MTAIGVSTAFEKVSMIERIFGSVVTIVFQIIFCVEIYANDFCLFFKNYF